MSGFYSDIFTELARDSDLMRIFIEGGADISRLDKLERARYFSICAAECWNWQNLYYQRRQRALEPVLWESHLKLVTNVASLPGFRACWTERQNMFSDEFQGFMEKEIFTGQPLASFQPFGYQ